MDSDSRSYIDFGNLRANARAKLPASTIEEFENHATYLAVMDKEGIDDAWRQELMERLNDVSDITGIEIQPDE